MKEKDKKKKKTSDLEEKTAKEAEQKTSSAADMPVTDMQIAELEKKILYLRAEVENIKKRFHKDKVDSTQAAEASVWNDVFPFYVNLHRAIHAFDGKHESSKRVCDGIEMILKEFETIFTRRGLQVVSGTQCPFDPNVHEAMDTEERSDLNERIVLQEYEPGFKFRDRLIRAAKVKVGIPAKNKPVEGKAGNGHDKE